MNAPTAPSREALHVRSGDRRGRAFDELPAEAQLAGLMDLIANPILEARDRTRQFRRFHQIVMNALTLKDAALIGWGDAMWRNGGRDLRRMVADARAGRPLAL